MSRRVLETYHGLYIDLSSLTSLQIDRELLVLRTRYPYLGPDIRRIYSQRECYRPPTQEELDRRERENSQLTASFSSAAAELGRKGGQSTTPAKTQASRTNGKKGGRPACINSDAFD